MAEIPHDVFILPPLLPPRRHDLTLLILADGNRRGSPDGGYAGGARRVIAVAEHLARRPDVSAMAACLLSPENLEKRGEGFFHDLYKAFIGLGVEIETRGALVASGVRVEVRGDLRGLRARGGRAAALADAAVAVAVSTARVARPELRLVLVLGYDRDTADALAADIILRTGMEEENALRLSGLRTHPHVENHATTTLWPDISLREIDEVIDRAARRTAPRLAPGHDPDTVIELGALLARAGDIGGPVRVTITTSVPSAALTAALGRHQGGRHELRLAGDGGGAWTSVLAPGQRPPSFTLPSSLLPDHANVHGCAATAPGIVEGIREAVRFTAAHPALRGGDRVLEGGGDAAERDEAGDRFAARILAWASAAGLLLAGTAWRRAALGYALTGFFIHHRVPTEWDPEGAGWEARAELAARYMILVAAGDEGIFDRVLDGETAEQRLARLEVSADFLRSTVRRDGPPATPPEGSGAELLGAIAAGWQEILCAHERSCLPAAARSFRAGLDRLYAASVAEHRALRPLAGEPGEIEARCAAAPPCVAARARALDGAEGELRALLYLVDVGAAVGAGALFRAAALAAPAGSVPEGGVAALDAVTALLDYPFRLANDRSGFLDAAGGDRDAKQNACSILVPAEASGPAREAAIVAALAASQRLSAWLAGELGAEIERLSAVWPSMGVVVRRGVHVGRRVYEVGHYTTVSRARLREIFDDADRELS